MPTRTPALISALLSSAALAACASVGETQQAVADAPTPVLQPSTTAATARAPLDRRQREYMQLAALDALAAAEEYPALVARLNAPSTTASADVDATWMEDRLRTGAASSVLAEPYMRHMQASGRAEEMHFWYLYGAMTLQIDAARCDDATAPMDTLNAWRRATRDIAFSFDQIEPAQQRRTAESVLRYEEFTANRRGPDRWLCSQGARYWAQYFMLHPERRGVALELLPRDLSIPIRAVSDAAWNRKRVEIRTIYHDALVLGRQRDLTGVTNL